MCGSIRQHHFHSFYHQCPGFIFGQTSTEWIIGYYWKVLEIFGDPNQIPRNLQKSPPLYTPVIQDMMVDTLS